MRQYQDPLPAVNWRALRPVHRLVALAVACISTLPLVGCQQVIEGLAELEERTIPRAEWIEALGPIAGATVRLNNYSPAPVDGQPPASRFYVANDSQIVFADGASLGFDIPMTRRDPYTIYVNDINSTSIEIDTAGRSSVIAIAFEDDGYELVGNCVENVACICGDPLIDLAEPELRIGLGIGAADGRLAITSITARFSSDYSEVGPCRDNACAFLCDVFAPDRESRAREIIEREAVRFVEMNRGLIEGLLNARLRHLGVTQPIATASIQPGSGDLQLFLRPE